MHSTCRYLKVSAIAAAVLLLSAAANAAEVDLAPAVATVPDFKLTAAGYFNAATGKVDGPVVVHVIGDRIQRVGVGDNAVAAALAEGPVEDLGAVFLSPGFIDAHVQLLAEPETNHGEQLNAGLPRQVINGVIAAETTLRAGVTTVRMLGAPGYGGVALRDAITEGDVIGPRILTAGVAICITGAHCGGEYRLPYEANPAHTGVADGPWAARRLVRQNRKFGADLITTCSSDGAASKGADAGAPQGTLEELQAIVEEANSYGMTVACGAHGATAIKVALKAGVDSIEHASFIDDEGIRLAKANDAALVMDIYGTEYLLSAGETAGALPESMEKERRVGQIQRDNFRKAHDAGVRLVFGTDAGVFPHGDNLRQLSRMVDYGMTPAEALQAATIHAAKLLGIEGEVGELRAGASADFVVLPANPLEDISVVMQPITVYRAGTPYDGVTRSN
ncbi:MAG: amidohydrolase family protein [Pseudomonadota bacterium]